MGMKVGCSQSTYKPNQATFLTQQVEPPDKFSNARPAQRSMHDGLASLATNLADSPRRQTERSLVVSLTASKLAIF